MYQYAGQLFGSYSEAWDASWDSGAGGNGVVAVEDTPPSPTGPTCSRCGARMQEEERRWGAAWVCGCGHAQVGAVSEWARANMERPRLVRGRERSDNLADAMGYWPGVGQPATPTPHRREYDPDAEAAAEEADIASWR